MSKKMIKSFLEHRCSIYFLLKSMYINEPSVEELMDIVTTCKKYKNIENVEISEEENSFREYFITLNKNKIKKMHEDIRVEFARLYLGPKHVIAPPYESVYRTKTRHMFGFTTAQVRRLYENAGIRIDVKENIPDDFIGFELEFMYYLAFETLKAFIEENEDKFIKLLKYQHHFLDKHLSIWIEDFSGDIVKNTTSELFKVTADYTKQFILEDKESLLYLI